MSRETVAHLMDRWINEPAFRTEMRKDPEAAVRSSGMALDEDEWAAVHGMDWNLPDAELQARMSKL